MEGRPGGGWGGGSRTPLCPPHPRQRTQASGRGINTRVIAGAPSAAAGPWAAGRAPPCNQPPRSPRRPPPGFEGSQGTRGGPHHPKAGGSPKSPFTPRTRGPRRSGGSQRPPPAGEPNHRSGSQTPRDPPPPPKTKRGAGGRGRGDGAAGPVCSQFVPVCSQFVPVCSQSVGSGSPGEKGGTWPGGRWLWEGGAGGGRWLWPSAAAPAAPERKTLSQGWERAPLAPAPRVGKNTGKRENGKRNGQTKKGVGETRRGKKSGWDNPPIAGKLRHGGTPSPISSATRVPVPAPGPPVPILAAVLSPSLLRPLPWSLRLRPGSCPVTVPALSPSCPPPRPSSPPLLRPRWHRFG